MRNNRAMAAATGTQQQIKLLAASNACLRRNLIRFSHGLKQDRQLAYRDELTGLPNRTLLLDRLHQAMQQTARLRKPLLLMFIDLDCLKWVNDQLGYLAGDRLLQKVAMRLSTSIRGGDTACRYGGDEFVVMLPEIEGGLGADAALDKIRMHLGEPYIIDGQAISLSASVGAAVYYGDDQTSENLLRLADLDMYRAKANSKPPTITPL